MKRFFSRTHIINAAYFTLKYVCILVFCTAASSLPAFEWPQLSENIAVYFAQKRGSGFAGGITFNTPAEVKAADSGHILITLKSDIEGGAHFPSALGNAVIVEHKNQILTVYGGMEKMSSDDGNGAIESGAIIGISGYSGWKKGNQSFEFQVIDTKIKAAINPLILMDVQMPAPKFVMRTITAVHKNGTVFPLSNGTRLSAGTYTLYAHTSTDSMPYTIAVLVNGVLVEKTDYNALKRYKAKLCIQGGGQYDFETVYEPKNGMRLAEIYLSKGKNTVNVSVNDIGSNEYSQNIMLNVF